MLGNTHVMYGFILAEIIYHVSIKDTKNASFYKRTLLWLWGMIGGFSLDLDGLSGVFANLIFQDRPWSFDLFEQYHRQFSHGLGFLITTLFSIIIIYLAIIRPAKLQPTRPKFLEGRLSLLALVMFISGFLIYNDYTKYFAFFFILAMMLFLTLGFIQDNKPFYGIAFFGGALLHHVCDFIQCEWNPFGPWAPQVEVGLFLYCGGITDSIYNLTMNVIFEFTPHFIVLIIIIHYVLERRQRVTTRKDENG